MIQSSASPALLDHGATPFLSLLPDQVKDEYLKQGTVVSYPAGNFIFERYAPADILVMLEGAVRLEAIASNGKRIELVTVGRGQAFGHAAAFAKVPHICDAVAISKCRVHHMSQKGFERFCDEYPIVYKHMLKILSEGLMTSIVALDELRRLPMEEQFGQVLLRTAKPRTNEPNSPLFLETTQCALSDLAGISRATTVRILTKLRQLGLVETGYGEITLPDPSALRGWLEKTQTP